MLLTFASTILIRTTDGVTGQDHRVAVFKAMIAPYQTMYRDRALENSCTQETLRCNNNNKIEMTMADLMADSKMEDLAVEINLLVTILKEKSLNGMILI